MGWDGELLCTTPKNTPFVAGFSPDRRVIITVRGQSYVSRLPKY